MTACGYPHKKGLIEVYSLNESMFCGKLKRKCLVDLDKLFDLTKRKRRLRSFGSCSSSSDTLERMVKRGENNPGNMITAAKCHPEGETNNGENNMEPYNYGSEEQRSIGRVINVDYALNTQRALSKKRAACDRETYKIDLFNESCKITFSTAVFELFRTKIVEYFQHHASYVVEIDPVVDMNGSTTGDVMKVFKKTSCNRSTPDKLFTINMYRTSSRILVNGSQYKMFVCSILPSITELFDNYGDIFREANRQIKEKILKEQVVHNKRNRKKKVFTDFHVETKSICFSDSGLDDVKVTKTECSKESSKDEKWNSEPKYWKMLGRDEWTQTVASECNRPKGCLSACGKNNSRDMVRCDGCGRWGHFNCVVAADVDVNNVDDFICTACKEVMKSEDAALDSGIPDIIVPNKGDVDGGTDLSIESTVGGVVIPVIVSQGGR